jgi:hypothetical protein
MRLLKYAHVHFGFAHGHLPEITMKAAICTAIRELKVIRFMYDDELRKVEPFCYGESPKGKELLRAFQVGGGSETSPFGWKLFDVDKIELLRITEDTFEGRRPHYNPRDSAMERIFCRVPKPLPNF